MGRARHGALGRVSRVAEVALPFRPEWREAVLRGTKTTTVRTRRYGEPGDEFRVDGRRFALEDVRQVPLERARDECHATEGFATREAFEAHWALAHPTRGYRPRDAVWVHRFRALDPEDA